MHSEQMASRSRYNGLLYDRKLQTKLSERSLRQPAISCWLKSPDHKKDIAIRNRYALNTNTSTFVKYTLSNVKKQTEHSTTVHNFNTRFSAIDVIRQTKGMSWESFEFSDIVDKVGCL